MASGIIGKKVGMTSIFDEDGKCIPCTVIESGNNVVTQIKTVETDKYDAFQLSYDDKQEKNTPAPLKGHFSKAKTTPKKRVAEFRDFDLEKKVGDTIELDIFKVGDRVSVSGVSRGKGFAGVVKRHGFKGVGEATHGQHNRQRAPGSIGQSSSPSRVYKGMRMAGNMGNEKVTLKNVEVVKVYADKNLIVLKGAVPGHKGTYLTINKK